MVLQKVLAAYRERRIGASNNIALSTVEDPGEWPSLSVARAYLDSICAELPSVHLGQLGDALRRLTRAYRQYPELELEHHRREVSRALCERLASVPAETATPLLMQIAEFDPSSAGCMAVLLRKVREAAFSARADLDREDSSALLPDIDVADIGSGSGSPGAPNGSMAIDGHVLGKFARSIRCSPSSGRADEVAELRDSYLDIAERFRPIAPIKRAGPRPGIGWPTAQVSFEEFVMQWPCEVLLPSGLDDITFIDAAHRLILMRPPSAAETKQYLRLLHDNVLTRRSFIEELLIGEELRSLERRVRAVYEGQVIVDPSHTDYAEMPAIEWPCFAATDSQE